MGKRKRQDEEEDVEDEENDHSEMLEEMVASGALKLQNTGAATANNKPGLLQALQTIRQDLPWIERLEVVSAEPANIKNVNDDLQVELAFYGQALAAVVAARGELDRLGVPHRRPTDYFAEMLKSDDHMKRVKEKLLLEKQKITAVEHRKKEKDAATFNKQAAAEKARTKASEKRSAMQAVDAWRKGKAGNRPELENEADLEKLFDSSKAGKASAAARQGQGGSRFPSKSYSKRQGKDKKYGHGGPKRDQKRNSADSSSSMGKGERGGYSAKGMKSSMPPGLKGGKFGGRKGGAKGGARKNAGGSRPGKRARMAGHK